MKEELEYSLLQLKLAERYKGIIALRILTEAYTLDQLRQLDTGRLTLTGLN